VKVKEKGRNNAGNDNTKRCSENFEHIVSVFHDRGHNQATDCLYCHHCPGHIVVTPQEAMFGHRFAVFEIDGHVSDNDRRQPHLHVSKPEGGAAALENLFKVNAAKSTRTGRAQTSQWSKRQRSEYRYTQSRTSELNGTGTGDSTVID
jgi:hypothetical protein